MKNILITGATSGIGKATAYLLASQGHSLILCGRNQEVLTQLKSELSSQTKVHTLQFDVRNVNDVNNAFGSLPEGFRTIDVLINNAGNAHGLASLEDGDINDWDAMMDGNVKGLLYVSKQVIPGMKLQESGHIINISSIAGLQTYANGVVYCASKKAVEAISDGMRLELTEFGIKVTTIRPGAVETEFSKVRFKGDTDRAATVYAGYEPLIAEDIAEAISYCINVPSRVSIASLDIFPSAQASATTIYRK